jgi:hypothetical protein
MGQSALFWSTPGRSGNAASLTKRGGFAYTDGQVIYAKERGGDREYAKCELEIFVSF